MMIADPEQHLKKMEDSERVVMLEKIEESFEALAEQHRKKSK